MTVSVQQQVLGLEITVDDLLLVKVLECEGDFRGIEFGDGVGEPLHESPRRQYDMGRDGKEVTHLRLAEETEEFTTLDKVHDHVQIPGILPCTPQCD